MFPLLQITYILGPALVYFMDVVINDANSLEEAIKMLEVHFIDDRAGRVNDDLWKELTFEPIKTM